VSPARRPRARPVPAALAALAVAALLALAACTPATPRPEPTVDSSVTRAVEKAVEAADPGLSEASASTSRDGFTTELSVLVSSDADAVDSTLLRGILQGVLDGIGEAKVDQVTLAVYRGPRSGGDRLALWPAASDLGFGANASGSDIAFTEQTGDIRSVLKK
jgi:hypothetical protein